MGLVYMSDRRPWSPVFINFDLASIGGVEPAAAPKAPLLAVLSLTRRPFELHVIGQLKCIATVGKATVWFSTRMAPADMVRSNEAATVSL